MAEIRQRVMTNADKLFNAQFAKAVGSVMIFEVVESKNKTEHVLVTDPETIKAVLDEGEGANCSVEGSFYLVTEVPPDNRAIDSMFDRTFGKAPQTVEIANDPELVKLRRTVEARANEKGTTYEHELRYFIDHFSDDVKPEVKEQLISQLAQ